MKNLLMIVMALLCLSGTVFAQDSYFGDFKSDTDMEIKAPGQNMLNKEIQYGGWFTPVMFYSKDKTSELAQSINTIRLWFRTALWDDASLYVRAKYTLTGTLPVGTYSSNTDHVVDLDIASLDMSFFNKQLTVQLGRKYFLIGSGLVLNNRADGMEVNYFNKYVNVQAIANYTGLLLADSNAFDIKTAELSSSKDYFFAGGTLSGSYFNQTLYFIALAQMQFERDSGSNKLETQFYGGGLKGAIIDGLTYYAEFVYQMGTATGTDFNEMGAAMELKYSLDIMTKPVFMFQYAYGSGSDTSKFVNYGTYNAGFGWNPELQNLHALRFGGSVSPTDMLSMTWLKRMSLIFKYSLYLVDDDSGVLGIGGEDTVTPAPGEKLAGHGLDFALRWRIFSDLSFFTNYGVFIPGAAMASTDPNRHFAMAGLNISF